MRSAADSWRRASGFVPFGDIVYVMPPLVIEPEDLAVLTGAIIDVVGEWSAALSSGQ